MRVYMQQFMHVSSFDENPSHGYCPTGEYSWYLFNEAEPIEQQPPNLETIKVKMSLNDDDKVGVHDAYESLTTDHLIGRFLKERAQNAKGLIHFKMWSKQHRKIVD